MRSLFHLRIPVFRLSYGVVEINCVASLLTRQHKTWVIAFFKDLSQKGEATKACWVARSWEDSVCEKTLISYMSHLLYSCDVVIHGSTSHEGS